MENIVKDIKDLQHDMKVMISHADTYKKDADRGVNVNMVQEGEDWPKEKQVESLISYLVDAKHDIDRLRDEMQEVLDRLEDLVDTVEYEAVAKGIR